MEAGLDKEGYLLELERLERDGRGWNSRDARGIELTAGALGNDRYAAGIPCADRRVAVDAAAW